MKIFSKFGLWEYKFKWGIVHDVNFAWDTERVYIWVWIYLAGE